MTQAGSTSKSHHVLGSFFICTKNFLKLFIFCSIHGPYSFSLLNNMAEYSLSQESNQWASFKILSNNSIFLNGSFYHCPFLCFLATGNNGIHSSLTSFLLWPSTHSSEAVDGTHYPSLSHQLAHVSLVSSPIHLSFHHAPIDLLFLSLSFLCEHFQLEHSQHDLHLSFTVGFTLSHSHLVLTSRPQCLAPSSATGDILELFDGVLPLGGECHPPCIVAPDGPRTAPWSYPGP